MSNVNAIKLGILSSAALLTILWTIDLIALWVYDHNKWILKKNGWSLSLFKGLHVRPVKEELNKKFRKKADALSSLLLLPT